MQSQSPVQVKQLAPIFTGPTVPEEHQIYYYHGDHLGSSTVISDRFGRNYEHLQYFPYGETWVEETRSQTNLPYKFTGKELDPETGLYYFGARYYDARVGVWESVDPALEEYLPVLQRWVDAEQSGANYDPQKELIGLGGIYNSVNLNLYGYTHLTPLKYNDPDGRAIPAVVAVCASNPACSALVVATVVAVANGVRNTADYISKTNESARAEAQSQSVAIENTKDNNVLYNVRVQVQGKKMSFELGIPISKDRPVKALEAITALRAMQSQVTKRDAKLLGDSFEKAEIYIQNIANNGGVGPIGSKSFSKQGVSKNDARVDVEVNRGPVNLVH